jgi:hypothetical protein
MPRRSYLQQIAGGPPGSTRVLRPQNALLRRWELTQSSSWLAETQIEQSSPQSLEADYPSAESTQSLAPGPFRRASRIDATAARDYARGSEPIAAPISPQSSRASSPGPSPEIEDTSQTAPSHSAIRPTQRHRNESDLAGAELSTRTGRAIRGRTAAAKAQRMEHEGSRPDQSPKNPADDPNGAEADVLARHAARTPQTLMPALHDAPVPANRRVLPRTIDAPSDDAGPAPTPTRVARPPLGVKPATDPRPEVRIGTVEVVITPPPAPVVPPSRSMGERRPALSRGYSSAIGLRQR